MITTERLVLRRPELRDASAIQTLAGAREVALNTLTVPHPYPDGAAEAWIEKHGQDAFAITLRENDEVVGMIGIHVNAEHAHGEIGYWIGVPYQGRGYASEAARAVIDYGFGELKLNRVFAEHFARNPASGRVMQKVGMTYEGTLRQHHKKWGEFVDAAMYSILRSEWRAD
jgi:ribosomal-protein-alanine N-acetyltransferase